MPLNTGSTVKRFVEIEDVEHNVDKQDVINGDAKLDNAVNAIKETTHERIMEDEAMQFSSTLLERF